MPNSSAEGKPRRLPCMDTLGPRNRFSLINPKKYSPNSTTTAPHTTLSAVRCCRKNDPTVPASAPMATNTKVNPSTKPRAFLSTVREDSSSPAAK